MPIGALRVDLRLRGVHSLKEKRGMLAPLLARIRNDLHCAAAEVEHADVWQSSVLEIACVNSDRVAAEATLRRALYVIESGGEVEVVDHHIDVT
ncbi:MAG TPA: DUF503 domain-containing protein [Candidatus Dormibacteraeota bacterium]|nr:DUF503 domain-containing protein [Candidatus Dormibacteraeota bacterium]